MTCLAILPKEESSREAEVRFPKIAPEVRTSRDGNLALGEVSGGHGWHKGVIRGQYMGSGHLITSLR